MLIAIKNQTSKSFIDRLKALKSGYQISMLRKIFKPDSELYYFRLKIEDDLLPSFAQDAKFGFGNELQIERVLADLSYDYQTENHVDLGVKDITPEQLLTIKEQLQQTNTDFVAIELSYQTEEHATVKVYVNSEQEQQAIVSLLS